jgi:hypothetical protein
MSIEKKSVVEDTLLQIKAVEEAISENAKGILASTMKEEISELVRESLQGSKKRKKSLYEQEEQDLETPEDIEDIEDEDLEGEEDLEDEEGMDDEEELDVDFDAEPTGTEIDVTMTDDNQDEIAPLDMTSASPEEVLKVFKAMGDEDGIIVKKEGGYLHLSDNETNRDYMIQTEGNNRRKKMRSNINENRNRYQTKYLLEYDDEEKDEEFGEGWDDEEKDEVMYELSFNEEDTDLEEMEESFKPKGRVGKMKEFKYPKTMKRGVAETSDEDDELGEGWDLEEEEDLITNPASPKGLGMESFKPKGRIGKPKFSYPKTLKKGVTEVSDDEDELGEGWDDEEKEGETTEASRTMTYRRRAERGRVTAPSQVRNESFNKEMKILREKNEEYKKALDFFRNKLNEVAVFNSNLAYSTRLFTEHSTTKQEKINILRRFDNVESLKESKNLYKSIKGELDGKNVGEVVTESIQRKVTKTPQTGSAANLIESKTYENPQFLRMKDLMDKIN